MANHAQRWPGADPDGGTRADPGRPLRGFTKLAGQVNKVGFAGALSSTDEVTAFAAAAQARAFELALRSGLPWWRRLLWRVDPRPLRRRR